MKDLTLTSKGWYARCRCHQQTTGCGVEQTKACDRWQNNNASPIEMSLPQRVKDQGVWNLDGMIQLALLTNIHITHLQCRHSGFCLANASLSHTQTLRTYWRAMTYCLPTQVLISKVCMDGIAAQAQSPG